MHVIVYPLMQTPWHEPTVLKSRASSYLMQTRKICPTNQCCDSFITCTSRRSTSPCTESVFSGETACSLLKMAEADYIMRTPLNVINTMLLPKEWAIKESNGEIIYRVHLVRSSKPFPNIGTQAVCTACGSDRCTSVCFIYWVGVEHYC